MGDEEEKKKLPYFHRTLNEHDANLVGKNEPRIIGSNGDSAKMATESDEKLTTASAWNAAQSWEERDATAKCSAKLKEILEGAVDQLSEPLGDVNSTIISCEIDDAAGNASVTHSRGKVRYMYEFTIDFKYECEVDGTTYSGNLKCLDLTNDQDEDDYEIQQEWNGARPLAKPWGDKIRKALVGSAFKEALKKQMTVFEEAFQAMF